MYDHVGPSPGTAPPPRPTIDVEPQARDQRPLGWFAVLGYVLVLPREFYSRQIHRLAPGRALIASVVNLLAALALIVAACYVRALLAQHCVRLSWGDRYDSYGYDKAGDMALDFLIAWGIVVLCCAAASVLFAAAVSGAATFGQAYRRSLGIVGSLTFVLLVLALIVALLTAFAAPLSAVFELRVDYWFQGAIVSIFFWLLAAWPTVLVFMALSLDGRRGPQIRRELVDDRCENCGYMLLVIPDTMRCPVCRWSVDDSLDRERREPLSIERGMVDAWLISAMAICWRGFWRPARLWWKSRVRTPSASTGNAFLAMAVVGTAVGGLLAFMSIGAVAVSGKDHGLVGVPALLVPRVMWLGLVGFWVGLVVNHVVLIAAMAVARLRGNSLRFDELARIGYCSLGLPAAFEIAMVLLATGLACMLILPNYHRFHVVEFGVRSAAERTAQLVKAGLVLGVAALSLIAMLGSLISAICAMESARYANR